MTIYENIKAAISVKQAAEHYGLKVNRSGMTCCPFHNDRHPSLKLNEDYFFCFGCGAKGDVIDLVAKLFNLSNHEAVQKLAADFGLDPKPPTAAAMVKPKRPYIRQFREDEMLCFRVLTDYLHILDDFGMERGTEYGLEQVFNVIDSRYRSGKPLIVTTNLALDDLRNPEDTAHSRIYDRLLSMCVPVRFTGDNFRQETAQRKMESMKKLITD